ncbi:unnamed protein product [Orchesella dallaii]|uniref:DUF4419 domain-containing protein n=1 Tax=Orchesella dallaii TaxID=48710 RepID=A0ABP1PS58_9HEXA
MRWMNIIHRAFAGILILKLRAFSCTNEESASTSTSTTFRVFDKDPLNVTLESIDGGGRWEGVKVVSDSSQIIRALPGYGKNNLTEILQSTKFPAQSLSIPDPGFVPTVVQAYNHHFNLVLRPDDIWAAIMTQFSFYRNKNAEKYRKKFVNFEGKRKLVVTTSGSLHTVSYSWLTNAMTNEINKNLVDPQVKNWILPTFTTTTENDKVAVGVVFMAAMKKYFTYVSAIFCGIPFITLEGTVEDWRNVLDRLEKLKEYDLQPWYELLHPIISKFVDAKEGKIDQDFWKAIVDRKAGSGYDYVSGWITAFCVFDIEGNWQRALEHGRGETPLQKWLRSNQTGGASSNENSNWLSNPNKWPRIDIKDIPSGIVEVDVKIDDHGKEYQSLMLAGHMAAEVTEMNGLTLKPALGWVIALKP